MLKYEYHWVYANWTWNISHSLIPYCPLEHPTIFSVVSAFLKYFFSRLKLIGNSAVDFYMFELSTTHISQHPNIGPLSGLHDIANWGRLSW